MILQTLLNATTLGPSWSNTREEIGAGAVTTPSWMFFITRRWIQSKITCIN